MQTKLKSLCDLRGVCSQCQTQDHQLEMTPYGEVVLANHESFGEHCKGSGMAPETTYDK